MTRARYEELSPAARSRLVTWALLRATTSTAVLVTAYYLIPFDRPVDPGTLVVFMVGLLVVAAVIGWEMRAIISSTHPRLRAVQAVAVGLPLLLLLFAATYLVLSRTSPANFTEALGKTDALYFTVTVFATVGFGDITPVSEVARILTMTQMTMGLIVVGLVAKILLGAVRVAEQRRGGTERGPAGSDGSSRTGGTNRAGGG